MVTTTVVVAAAAAVRTGWTVLLRNVIHYERRIVAPTAYRGGSDRQRVPAPKRYGCTGRADNAPSHVPEGGGPTSNQLKTDGTE